MRSRVNQDGSRLAKANLARKTTVLKASKHKHKVLFLFFLVEGEGTVVK